MFHLVTAFFGCSHKHCSFPRTAKPDPSEAAQGHLPGTYVVCLDCGEEIGYDWQRMKLVPSARRVAGDPSPEMQQAS